MRQMITAALIFVAHMLLCWSLTSAATNATTSVTPSTTTSTTDIVSPTPSMTSSASAPSQSISPLRHAHATPSLRLSETQSRTLTPPAPPTPTVSLSVSISRTITPPPTPTATKLLSLTETLTKSSTNTITPPPTPTPTRTSSPSASISELPSVVWKSPVEFALVTWMFRFGVNVSSRARGSIVETNPRTLCSTCPGPVINWGTMCSQRTQPTVIANASQEEEEDALLVEHVAAARSVATALCYQVVGRLPSWPGVPMAFTHVRDIPGWEYTIYNSAVVCSSVTQCEITAAHRNCTHQNDLAIACDGDVQLIPAQLAIARNTTASLWQGEGWSVRAVSTSTGHVFSNKDELLAISAQDAGMLGETTPLLRSLCTALLKWNSEPPTVWYQWSGVSGFVGDFDNGTSMYVYAASCDDATSSVCGVRPVPMVDGDSLVPLRVDCQPVIWSVTKLPAAESLTGSALFVVLNASHRFPVASSNYPAVWCNHLNNAMAFQGYSIGLSTGTVLQSGGFRITSCPSSNETLEIFESCAYLPNATLSSSTQGEEGFTVACSPRIATQSFRIAPGSSATSMNNPLLVQPNKSAPFGYLCYENGKDAQRAAAVVCAAVNGGSWVLRGELILNRTVPYQSSTPIYRATCDADTFSCTFMDATASCDRIAGSCCGLSCPTYDNSQSSGFGFPEYGSGTIIAVAALACIGFGYYKLRGGGGGNGDGDGGGGNAINMRDMSVDSGNNNNNASSSGMSWGWAQRSNGSWVEAQTDHSTGWIRTVGNMNTWQEAP